MSEQEQEQTQEQGESETPAEATPIQPPDEDEEAEADEADAVEGHDADEPEPEPEQPQALSEKQLEAVFGKLDRERKRHDARVREILGEDAAALVDCPLCDTLTPGYVLPMPNTPERFPSVREFMGDAQPAEYQQDPNTRTCLTCAGEGVVETGSRVDSQRLLACTDCNGKGWQGSRAPSTVGPVVTSTPIPDENGHAVPAPLGPEPPEAAKLRAMGYTLIQPVGT